jgi:hypothetical protein
VVIIGLFRAQAWWDKRSVDAFHVRNFLQFTASNFKGCVRERSIEFLLTDIGEQQGKYRQWN